jgi:hypothetical protein
MSRKFENGLKPVWLVMRMEKNGSSKLFSKIDEISSAEKLVLASFRHKKYKLWFFP